MSWKLQRRWVWIGLPLLGLLVFAAITKSSPTEAAAAAGEIPVVNAQVGDLSFRIHTIGEVRSVGSVPLTAPPIGGGGLQITKLLASGTRVEPRDLVIEFDPSEQEYLLESNRSELLQAEETIQKAKADAAVQVAQDRVALLKARFDVRRAELEVRKNELMSSIDVQKNQLALEQAKRILAQLEHDAQSHTALHNAAIAVAGEKRHKAELAMQQAQQNMEKMQVRAPMAGIIGIEMNMEAIGGMFWGGMSVPEYRQGDQTRSGSVIARVIDPSSMEVVAAVHERDRGNLKLGQQVEIELDAYPGAKFDGKIKTLSGAARREFWETGSSGKFDVSIEFSKPDPRLRSGLTAHVLIMGETKKNALSVPRQAILIRDGKRVVYVKNGAEFTSREVKILGENESRAAVEGLRSGDEVALRDPTLAPASGHTDRPNVPAGGITP